jgi:hypothetical protein
MATYYSQGDGDWSTLANWDTNAGGGGSDPASVAAMDNNTFIIQSGHDICFDVDMSGFANGLTGLTIQGHATTPAMLYAKYSGAGTYYLKIKTGASIIGTNLVVKGRLLANSDGVWGHSGDLPFDRKFIIELVTTASLDASYLDIALYDTEPLVKCVTTYGAVGTVTASASTNLITWASHGRSANDPVMFKVSGGALPAPLMADVVYFVRSIVGDTFRVARTQADTYLIDLTSDGSGTIQCYTGHTNTATAEMNVFEDISADVQWTQTTPAVVLCNSNILSGYDQQRVTLSGYSSSTVTLSENVNSAQYPGARVWLAVRNVAIRSSCVTSTQAVGYTALATHGGVFQCEIRSTAGTGTTFYGYGIYAGVGNTLSGVYSGFSYGITYPTRATISAVILACGTGIYRCAGSTFSGQADGCNATLATTHTSTIAGEIAGTSYGSQYAVNSLFSGTIRGTNVAFYQSSNAIVRGAIIRVSALAMSAWVLVESSDIQVSATSTPYDFNWTGVQASELVLLRITVRGLVGWSTPPLFGANRNVTGADPDERVCHEDYGGVLGAHRTFWTFGDVIRNTSVVRDGGATTSLEVVPLSNCAAPKYYIPILEWSEYDVPASAQVRTIYIKGEGWSGNYPLDTELWFEAEYYSAAVLLTKTTVHTYDAAQGDLVIDDNDNWHAFTLSFEPLQVGVVRYRAYLAKYAAACKVYVDNMLVTG